MYLPEKIEQFFRRILVCRCQFDEFCDMRRITIKIKRMNSFASPQAISQYAHRHEAFHKNVVPEATNVPAVVGKQAFHRLRRGVALKRAIAQAAVEPPRARRRGHGQD